MASTRKQCRERLASNIYTTGATGATAVFDYLPNDLLGANKVICIYNDATRHEQLSANLKNDFYRFNVDALVLRAAATSEDDLDNLHEAIRSQTIAAVSDSTWNEITIEQDSECFFADIAGIQYRVEQHKVLLKVTQ